MLLIDSLPELDRTLADGAVLAGDSVIIPERMLAALVPKDRATLVRRVADAGARGLALAADAAHIVVMRTRGVANDLLGEGVARVIA